MRSRPSLGPAGHSVGQLFVEAPRMLLRTSPAAQAVAGQGMSRRRRVGLAFAALVGAFVLYEIVTTFIAYTADAFVLSDLVALAPEVTGRIIAVHVADNQDVARGDLLANIDPVPFELL